MIRGVIFDMDGVLVKTIHLAEKVAREKLGFHGIELFADDIECLSGFSWKEFLGYVCASRGRKHIEGLYEDILETYSSRLADEVVLYTGVGQLLRRFSAEYDLALVSGSSRRDIDANLGRFGLERFFKVTISAEEVERGKPAPDMYLSACRLLGLSPAACVGVEDSVLGVEAVIGAGMKCVAITQTVSADRLRKADIIIDSLGEAAAAIERLNTTTP